MSDALWAVGVALVVFGSLGNNFGTNLVSYAHKQELEDEKKVLSQTQHSDAIITHGTDIENTLPSSSPIQRQRSTSSVDGRTAEDPLLNSNNNNNDSTILASTTTKKKESMCSLRTVGVTIFVTGNLLTFAAFGFAAQSLLAALESIQFVSNIACAKYIHNEIITSRMLLATASIVIGNILVVIFSAHETALFTSLDIGYLYATNIGYWVYLGVALILWATFHSIFIKYYNSRVNDKILLSRHDFVEPFAFSVSSAIIGTQAVLQAKCMSMLIQVSARGIDNEFEKPWIWVILCAWIFFVVFWLKRLDLGLALFPPLFIIPVLQVFFVFFAIICGGIFFQEFNEFGAGQWVGFVFGVLLILLGVYGLAPTDKASVVVLPNEMAKEVAHDVKESIQEIPEALTSMKNNLEVGIKSVAAQLTPRMTPRNQNNNNITPRTNNLNTSTTTANNSQLKQGAGAHRFLDNSDMIEQPGLEDDEKQVSKKQNSISLSTTAINDSKNAAKAAKDAKGAKGCKNGLNDEANVNIKLKPQPDHSVGLSLHSAVDSSIPLIAPVKVAIEPSKKDEL